MFKPLECSLQFGHAIIYLHSFVNMTKETETTSVVTISFFLFSFSLNILLKVSVMAMKNSTYWRYDFNLLHVLISVRV